MKTCSKCGVEKELWEFCKAKSRGRVYILGKCKSCGSEINKKWRDDNAIHRKDYLDSYYAENKVILNDKNKKYRIENKDKERIRHKKYNIENSCKVKDYASIYREKNKVKISDRHKVYRENNKDSIAEKKKEWNKQNRSKIRNTARAWRANNKEHLYGLKKKWNQDNKDKIRVQKKQWAKDNPEKKKEADKRYKLKVRKMSHTLSEIASIFTTNLWPYSTKGKDDITKEMREIMGDINPIQKNSFLSMPNLGRELNLLQDVIKFEGSVGIERDSKLFRSIQRAFAKFFPTMKVEKDCVDSYSINTDKVFDVAHLDYNGGLTESHIQAAKKLVSDGTMTFITLNQHQRFEKMEMFRPLEELTSIGNVVFEKEYFGKRKCPMITLGITA